MIHESTLHPNSIYYALALMPKLMALPGKIDNWGDGARTESEWICVNDVVFGARFWTSAAEKFDAFCKACHTDPHAPDFQAYLERQDGTTMARFVCVSGKYKTT